MKWEELEHHFRAETRQDPPPFGEGVIEWDYSRYTRALGLGRTPGLDTLKRRGCAVAAGRPEFWDEVAERMESWSEERGWRFLKLSARPSTVVPDPVIYHLGVEVTGVGRLSNRVVEIPAPAHAVGHQPTDSKAVRAVALGSDSRKAPPA